MSEGTATSVTSVIELVRAEVQDAMEPEAIDDDTSFFDVDMNSLVVTTIVANLSDLLGVDVPPVLVFENPSICELAEVIEQELL